MSAWSSGYVEGLDYTHGFYKELTPSLIGFASLLAQHRFDIDARRLQYCELGCGQGFTVNLLAAANPAIDFYTNDFNPSHIAGARALAGAAELANIRFYDHDFAALAGEASLPETFDVIALHGVMSWVSPSVRKDVVDFLSRRLEPGGLVYVSYNTLPGWAAMLPLRRLLVDHAARQIGPLDQRIGAALAYAQSLAGLEAGYFRHNAAVGSRLDKMASGSRAYLAHEYFNRDWTPFHFEDMAAELAAARLSHLGPIDVAETIDRLALTAGQRAVLEAEPDPLRRQSLRDVLVDQQFRTDLFVRGPRRHTFRSGVGAWLDMRFVLVAPPQDIPATLHRRDGVLSLDPDIYPPLLEALSEGPLTVRRILAAPGIAALSWEQVTEALTLLVGIGLAQPCLAEAGEDERLDGCTAFNRAVCREAEETEHLQFLASPVTGGGFAMDRFEQLFLTAIGKGRRTPSEWADHAWSLLRPQGQRLLRGGAVLAGDEENVAELVERAGRFAAEKLDLCSRLKIAV